MLYQSILWFTVGMFLNNSPCCTHFIKELETCIVTYNTSFTLSCVANEIPAPYYDWYLNDTLISTNGDFTINGGSLTVSLAKFNHSGLYMCVTMNDIQKGVWANVSTGFVNIEANIPEKSQHVLLSKTLPDSPTFCSLFGHPDPKVVQKYFKYALTKAEGRLVVHQNGNSKTNESQEKKVRQNKCAPLDIKENASEVVIDIDKLSIKYPKNRIFKELTPLAQLLCDAIYKPSLAEVFEWYRDSQNHTHSKRQVIEPSQILHLEEILEMDGETYLCKVFGMDGNKIISTDAVEIISPPTDLNLSGSCESANAFLSWKSMESSAKTQFVVEYAAEYATGYVAEHVSEHDIEYTPEYSDVWNFYKIVVRECSESSVELDFKQLPRSAHLVFRVSTQVYDIYNQIIASSPGNVISEICITPPGFPLINPQNLRPVTTSEGRLKIKWDKLDPLDQPGPGFLLVINYTKYGEAIDNQIKVNGNITEVEIPHSSIGNEYSVKVFAANDYGRNPETVELNITLRGQAPFVAVSNFREHSVSHSCVDLLWDNIPSVSNYRVFCEKLSRNGSSLEENFYTVLAVSSATICGLMPATNYKIAISMLNGNVPGPLSGYIHIRTLDKPSDVDMPHGTVRIFGAVVYLTWKPVTLMKNEFLFSYIVQYYQHGNSSSKKAITLSAMSSEVYITDLKGSTNYTIEVAMRTLSGKGKPWVIKSVCVGLPGAPGQPAAPKVVSLSETVLNVTFSLPKNYSGDLPSQYFVYYQQAGSKELLNKSAKYPEHPWVLLNFLKSTRYRIYTVGVNIIGESIKSNYTIGCPHNPKKSSKACFLIESDYHFLQLSLSAITCAAILFLFIHHFVTNWIIKCIITPCSVRVEEGEQQREQQSEHPSEQLSEHPSEQLSEHPSEQLSEQLSEHPSEQLNEQLSESPTQLKDLSPDFRTQPSENESSV